MTTTSKNSKVDPGWDTEHGAKFAERVRALSHKTAVSILVKHETLAAGRKSVISKLDHVSVLNLLMRALIDGAIPESELPSRREATV